MSDNFIKCRDGKEREIFPALIKHKNKIRHYVTKFRTDIAILNMLSPDLQKAADMSKEDADEIFSDEPYNAMMEMLVIAFGQKYTADEISEFVDVSMIPNIFNIFFAASGYMNEAKKDTKEELSWNELIASIVSNTSMTVRDVQEVSYPELEELLEGMSRRNVSQFGEGKRNA